MPRHHTIVQDEVPQEQKITADDVEKIITITGLGRNTAYDLKMADVKIKTQVNTRYCDIEPHKELYHVEQKRFQREAKKGQKQANKHKQHLGKIMSTQGEIESIDKYLNSARRRHPELEICGIHSWNIYHPLEDKKSYNAIMKSHVKIEGEEEEKKK